MSKKFFFISFMLFCLTTPLQAEVLTISQEPAEFKALRAAYEKQLENASTPEKLQQLQQELEAAKAKSLQSPAITQKISSLESARDIEVKKIQALYNDRIEGLKKEAMDATERKYQVVFDNFKNNTAKNVKNQYIVDLKQLEDKLIRLNNLAGALVVQNERNKSMGLSTTVVAAPAVVAAPVVTPSAPAKSAPVEKKASQTAPASSSKISSANPQSYISKTQGLAGSGSNVVNNIYTFDVQLFGNETWLSFNGYGRTTNSSFGEVYLITPAGQRHQVASWSPDQLKATNYFGVKSANDVQPIKADITQFVNATGTYKVEFIYRDGNEPLTIYEVEIRTW
jgi:hypothetical protein